MRRIISFISSAIGLAFFALLLIPIIGPPLYAEVGNAVAPGTVVAKHEEIAVLSDTWTRRLFVDVRYLPADTEENETTNIAVDSATYDQLRVGAPVQVRYAPNATLRQIGNLATTRLTSQLPLASFVARAGNFLIGTLIAIVVWLALLWVWSTWKRWWLALALVVFMAGGVIYVGSCWPPPQPAGELVPSNATIRDVHLITRIWGGKRTPAEEAVQPYMIVELSFVPQGAAEPIVAVDVVDANSAPGLQKELDVPIMYSASEPRWAQIVGAQRTYYWKNLRSFGLIALMLAALLLFTWLFGRWRAQRARRATP